MKIYEDLRKSMKIYGKSIENPGNRLKIYENLIENRKTSWKSSANLFRSIKIC